MEKKAIENYRTIPLSRVKEMLGFEGKGFRTVIKWCKSKDIVIIGKGKRQRILESDWKAIQELAYVQAVKHKRQDWKYLLMAKGIKLTKLQADISINGVYHEKSQAAKNFLKEQ